jgi:hypothetical protein
MINRMFRVIETGQWATAVISDQSFADDGTEYACRLAVDLGLTPGTLEAIDVIGDDPRTGDLLWPPTHDRDNTAEQHEGTP